MYKNLVFRHVSEKDKTGKRYRGVNLDIFSIEDPDGKCTSVVVVNYLCYFVLLKQ